MWKIQKSIRKGDYLYALVPDHPRSTKNGYVLYHRIVMENHLGRLLTTKEVVHHLNGDKHDNRIENLQVLSNEEHGRLHHQSNLSTLVRLKCPNCKKVFVRRLGLTHLTPSKKTKTTFCSRSCSSRFKGDKTALENVLEIFRGKLLISDG